MALIPDLPAMHVQLDGVLEAEPLRQLQQQLAALPEASWFPGAETAGAYAAAVKSNRQLDLQTPGAAALVEQVHAALQAHPLFRPVAMPVRLHSLLFSRSGVGQGYGRHVDNPFMPGGRTDLSFTLALSEPDSYGGGELVLELPHGEEVIKLPAGAAILYPSSYLHRVEPVTAGERLVAVGWVQSAVRAIEQRELLFELETACRAIAAAHGRSDALDLLYRCQANLLRMWGG